MNTLTVDHPAGEWRLTTPSGEMIQSRPINPVTIDLVIGITKHAGLSVVVIGKRKKGKRVKTMASHSNSTAEVNARYCDALMEISRDGDAQINRNTVRALIRRGLLAEDGVTITDLGREFVQDCEASADVPQQEFTLSADGRPILPPSTNGSGHHANGHAAHDLSGEIATLRREVSDLTAQNEYLNDQVAKLRHVVTRLLRRHIDDDLAAALDLILQD